MKKYIGRTVEIIYQDQNGKLSQRRIKVESVRDGKLRAFCITSGAPRVFTIANILAAIPTTRKGAAI